MPEFGSHKRALTLGAVLATVSISGAFLIGIGYGSRSNADTIGEPVSQSFTLCHTGPRHDCVVDGDTFYLGFTKIRVADIDTPEVHDFKCQAEKDLGDRATIRFQQLLGAGQFTLQAWPGRDEDQYGRKLRIVIRNGHSLGDQLVSEGLARTWSGRREPWCT